MMATDVLVKIREIEMNSLVPMVGNWVSGDKFWDRKKEMDQFVKLIHERANIILTAQRRMGKTSLMHEAMERQKDQYYFFFLDLESSKSPADMIVDLSIKSKPHTHLWEKTKGLFSNVLKGIKNIEEISITELSIKFRAGLSEGDWDIKGNQLFDILASADKEIVVMLDEVPIFVQRLLTEDGSAMTPQGRARADHFLSWLRSVSQRHQDRISFVLTGSIGLEPILERAKLSATINHYTNFDLPPWDNATSIECLEALAQYKGVLFAEGAPQRMMEMLGLGIPHYVQKFFQLALGCCLYRSDEEARKEITIEDVETAYNDRLLGNAGLPDLSSYYERISKALGPEIMLIALEFLSEAASEEILSYEALDRFNKLRCFEDFHDTSLQQETLSILVHDGYFKKENREYVFAFKLLKDWWKSRYCYRYTPILEREN